MLPKFLYGTYKRYKSDTAIFISWLVETAKACGNEASIDRGEKIKPSVQSGKKSTSSTQQHKIKLKELRNLGYAIAQSAISVSPLVLATAKRAIALRKRCAKWFSSSRKGSDNSDEGHSYFISVLEEVIELLEPKSNKGTSSTSQQNGSKPEDEANVPDTTLTNRFLDLSVLETKNKVNENPPGMPARRLDIQVHEGDEDDEGIFSLMCFRIYCMFEDL